MKEKLIQDVLKIAKKDKEVIAVALFGSSLEKNGRDIDICLFLDKTYPNSVMSKKKSTYYISDKLDTQIFQQLPLYIRSRILKKNKILLNKNPDKLYELAVKTIKEFNFYKKGYLYFLEETLHG